MNARNLVTRIAAVVTSVALAASVATVTATGANAAKNTHNTVPHSATEPIMPFNLCVSAATGAYVNCATGARLNKKEIRYLRDEQPFFNSGRVINNGVRTFMGKRGRATQHVPVPANFIGVPVTVQATMSHLRDPGCHSFMFTLADARTFQKKVTLDKGKKYASGKGTTRVKGNALTITLPDFKGPRDAWFVDITVTRHDGKKYKVTVVGGKSAKSGNSTFTFGD